MGTNQDQITCGNCGTTSFSIESHGPHVWDPMLKKVVLDTGSFKLTCTFCGRSVTAWYGNSGWSFDRVYAMVKRALQKRFLAYTKNTWPQHFDFYNHGKQLHLADRTLPKNAFLSCGFCSNPRNTLTAFVLEGDHDVFQIVCKRCGRRVVVSYNDRGFKHARGYKLLSTWYVRKIQPKGKRPTHLRLFKEGSLEPGD